MPDSLAVLGRIKKFELDDYRRKLAAEQQKLDSLNKRRQKLIDDFEAEKAFVAENPAHAEGFGVYTEQYLKKRRALEDEISSQSAIIEQLRDEMSAVFKEQKTYEIVDNHRRIRQRLASELKEQKMLDEIGTNAYIKKHQD